jgi:hypothetical protein
MEIITEAYVMRKKSQRQTKKIFIAISNNEPTHQQTSHAFHEAVPVPSARNKSRLSIGGRGPMIPRSEARQKQNQKSEAFICFAPAEWRLCWLLIIDVSRQWCDMMRCKTCAAVLVRIRWPYCCEVDVETLAEAEQLQEEKSCLDLLTDQIIYSKLADRS